MYIFERVPDRVQGRYRGKNILQPLDLFLSGCDLAPVVVFADDTHLCALDRECVQDALLTLERVHEPQLRECAVARCVQPRCVVREGLSAHARAHAHVAEQTVQERAVRLLCELLCDDLLQHPAQLLLLDACRVLERVLEACAAVVQQRGWVVVVVAATGQWLPAQVRVGRVARALTLGCAHVGHA